MTPADRRFLELHGAKVEAEAWLRRFSAYLDAEARRARVGRYNESIQPTKPDPIPESWAALDAEARKRRRADAPCTCTLWPTQPCPRHGVPLSGYDAAVDAANNPKLGLRPFGCFCPIEGRPDIPSGDCRIHNKFNPSKEDH